MKDVSAILYTHAHADHSHGIDNIRSLNWLTGRALPLYADAQTLTELRSLFPYVFLPSRDDGRFFTPPVEAHELCDGEALTFGGLRVTSFAQTHGKTHSRGFRINDFGYSTDASDLDEAAFAALEGVKVWVVGAHPRKTAPHACQH